MDSETAIRGTAVMTAATGTIAVAAFGFKYALAWTVPPSVYGGFGVLVTLLGVATIPLGAGLPAAAVRFTARGNSPTAKLVAANVLAGAAIAGVVALVDATLLDVGTGPVVALFGALLVMDGAVKIVNSTLQGHSAFLAYGAASAANPVFKVALFAVAVLALARIDLLSVVLILVGAKVLTLGVGIGVLGILRRGSSASTGPDDPDDDEPAPDEEPGSTAGDLAAFAPGAFAADLGIALLALVGVWAVKVTLGTAAAGGFFAALLLARAPVLLTVPTTDVLFPAVAETGDPALLTRSGKYLAVLLVGLVVPLVVVGPDLFRALFPAEYAASAAAFPLLLVGYGGVAVVRIVTRFFQGLGDPNHAVAAVFAGVAVQIGGVLVAVRTDPLVGTAGAVCLGGVVAAVLIGHRYRRVYDVGIDPGTVVRWIAVVAVSGAATGIVNALGAHPVVSLSVFAGVYPATLVTNRLLTPREIRGAVRELQGS